MRSQTPTPEARKSVQTVTPVLGMHRSGTSMFTRLLNILGMELGEPLMKSGRDNPKGFWENEYFWSTDRRILKSLGFHESGYGDIATIRAIYDFAHKIDIRNESRRFQAFVTDNFANQTDVKHWGWKDPRSVVLYPYWINLLIDAGFEAIKPAIIFRHPDAVVRSLVHRGDIKKFAKQNSMPEHRMALETWKGYAYILLEIQEETACFISSHEMFTSSNNMEQETARCATHFALEQSNIDTALQWVSPTRTNSTNVESEQYADNEAKDLYAQLLTITNNQIAEFNGA